MTEAMHVDEYLDRVDYDFVGYMPSDEALMFVNFIKEVNDGSEENETPLVHLSMMDKAFNKKRRVAVMCQRGIGKTALFAEYLILFIAAFGYMPGFGKLDLMLYISDSIENGVKNLRRNVEFRYANSEFLQKLIPNKKIKVGYEGAGYVDISEYERQIAGGRKFTDIRLEFENHRGDRLVVKGYGAKTGVRGAKEMGQRPTLAIFDDIVSDTDAESPTIIGTIENTVYKAVSKALHPTRQKMVWLGTPFNESDPLYKAVESGAWEVACYPICEWFDSTTTKEEFRGSWPDRFPYEYVKAEFDEAMKLGKPQFFYQELMLRINSEEERLIPDSAITWYSKESMMDFAHSYNYYITSDFATSEAKKSDFSVILVWAVNNNNDRMLVDGWIGKKLLSHTLNQLFSLVLKYKKYNLMGVGIEISAQQKAFISVIEEKQIRENNFFHLLSSQGSTEKGIKPITNKFQRFLNIEPMFSTGKIWFPKELKNDPFMTELLNELKLVAKTNENPKKIGKARNDDVLDAIGMMSQIEMIASGIETAAKTVKRNDGIYTSDVEDEDNEFVSSYDI
jgi:phage terminase large subunit-like protein